MRIGKSDGTPTISTMPNDDTFDQYPERKLVDVVADLAKALAGSAIPGAGGLASLIQTSHARRLAEFHRRTANRIQALEETAASTLLNRAMEGDEDAREEILSIYATISRLVQEAMDEQKRQALADAMASSLLSPTGEEIERRYFLRCLADFETIHIQLISSAAGGVGAVSDLVNAPDILGDNAKAALKEVNDRGMVSMDVQTVNTIMTSSGMAADRRTPLGVRFLRFIGQDGARS